MAMITIIAGRSILDSYQLGVNEARLELMPIQYLQADLREIDHAAYRYAVEGDRSASDQFAVLAALVDWQLDELTKIEMQFGLVEPAQANNVEPNIIRPWTQVKVTFQELFQFEPGSPQSVLALKQAQLAILPVYDTINDFYHSSMKDLQHRLSSAQAVGEETFLAMIGAIVIGLGVLIGMGGMVGRSILHPIADLREAATKLGEKDFSHRIRLRNESDELGQLAKSINLASETLQKLYGELERRSTHDGLTGVLNRAAFDERLVAEFTGADRFHRPLSLLMVDIDFFKRVNDTRGHQAGDDVLQAVAKLLGESIREGDMLTRYGGEEFAVILPETDVDSAVVLAERLRQAVENTPIVSGLSEEISLTVSIGCASRSPLIAKPEDLIRTADSALYAAKGSGRNRVISSVSEKSLESTSTQRANAA